MQLPGGNPERFSIRPLKTPDAAESILGKRINTINTLVDLFRKLNIPQNFLFRRGKPLEIAIIGDGRPEEFVATQRFFGETANLEVIERDAGTLGMSEQFYPVLLDYAEQNTHAHFTRARFTLNDVFADKDSGNPVLSPGKHAIVALGIHPTVLAQGGIDLFVDRTAPNGVVIVSAELTSDARELQEAVTRRLQTKRDVEVISQGYVHVDKKNLSVSIQDIPDTNLRLRLPVDFIDYYAVALRKKTSAEIEK